MKGCRPMTDVEISSVFNQLTNSRDRALWTLGCRTGLRVSELLSLRIQDVLEYGWVGNTVTVAKCNTKGKIESRTLPLSQSAKDALQSYLGEFGVLDPRQPLFKSFQSQEAITRQQAHRILKGAFSSLQLTGKVASHSMRKSYCSRVHKALNNDILKTQKAMGHKSLSSTASYLNVDQDEVNAAILSQG